MDVVAIKLRELRRAQNWTQEELADRAGLEQSQVSAWEGARRRPTMDNVRKLARAFDMTQEELAREIGYLDPEPPVPRGDIFDRVPATRLISELHHLPTKPGQPTFMSQLKQLERLAPDAQERVIRQLARHFLDALRRELEREEEQGQNGHSPNGA